MKVLLVQMPFFTADTPSISLSLLRAALRDADVECDIAYLNLEFAGRLGLDLYSWIAGDAPPYLLFGDLVFARALHGVGPTEERLDELIRPLGTPGVPQVPAEIVDAFPDLSLVAEQFVDEMADGVPWGDYGLVGFATMFQIAPALALSRRVKQHPDPPPVILGGSYCESDMGVQLARSFPWIDFVARGESERLIVDLVRQLRHATTGSVAGPEAPGYDRIEGLVWRTGVEVHAAGETGRLVPSDGSVSAPLAVRRGPGGLERATTYELDLLPIPDYHDWMDQMDAAGILPRREWRLPIETSRGCWWGEKHHCTFCGLNGGTIAYRRKSPERALKEFQELVSQGVGMVHAVDDILDFKYFDSLLPELAALDHDVEIFYEVKANMTFERVKSLHDAGIVWIQPGIESLSSDLLELMDKGITAWRNARVLRYCAELSMGVAWNLLYGFPHERPEWFEAMVPLTASLSHLQPPYIECCQVRIHRFSPLFRGRDHNGLADVAPTPSYHEIFPFERDVVHRLAYYFTHTYVDQRDPNSYIQPLAEGVRRWHAEVWTAAFLSLTRDDVVHLIDTRAVATQRRAELRGIERSVYRGCLHAATVDQLCSELGVGEPAITAILDEFVERHWVAHLDDRFLSLAVPVDRHAPRFVPVPLLEESLVGGYTSRMARTHQGFVESVPELETLGSTLGRHPALSPR